MAADQLNHGFNGIGVVVKVLVGIGDQVVQGQAGGNLRVVLGDDGVKDVIAKSKGSSNAHNLVKATIAALAQMRDAYTVAGERGISMDKVFNG